MHSRLRAVLVLPPLLCLQSCAWWFFSGGPTVDRTRPVALVETTGGVEFGATTEFGLLTLGRTAKEGPCRVHYFLGPTPLVEDGEILSTGSMFWRAQIDLKTQAVRVLDRPPLPDDQLVAMWLPDGFTVQEVPVRLAAGDGVEGDVLQDPGRELPAGAAVFAETPDGLRFVGLVSARARVPRAGGGDAVFYTFAGLDRVRELVAIPQPWPVDYRAKYRPDDIIVLQPVR